MKNKKEIKVSDLIAKIIKSYDVKKVFAITGGASIHMIHSIAEINGVDYIPMHHEQGCGMAADGYSRVTKNIGVALATSGPGATNLITAICCSWFDSIPVLYITGQVTRFRMKGTLGVRQIGFQETEIISMVKSITKYSTQIKSKNEIVSKFKKAIQIAKSGRPGPVLIDIPDDIQRESIKNINLTKTNLVNKDIIHEKNNTLEKKYKKLFELISNSKRPIMVIGAGVRISNSEVLVKQIQKKLNIPIAPSWSAQDMWNSNSDFVTGSFGTHGTRAGNFIVQNCDLLISLGARLSTRETGSPLSSFARSAKFVVIDIDKFELEKFSKFGKKTDLSFKMSVNNFCKSFIKYSHKIYKKNKYKDWYKYIKTIKKKYPVVPKKPLIIKNSINPYIFFNDLDKFVSKSENIFVDTGSTIAWIMQAFKFNSKIRVMHDFNNTAMGYALPASIGGILAGKNKHVTCVVGEGSFMMNIQELSTIQRFKLPINIILINNNGYSMVKQTQDQWLNSKYYATSAIGGLSFPNFRDIAISFGLKYSFINQDKLINSILKKSYKNRSPRIIEVIVDTKQRVIPQSRFGFPIEDSDPMLSRKEFISNMLINN